MQSTNSVVQQTLGQSFVGEPLLLMGSLEDGFQGNTTLLDIVNFISLEAEEFITTGLAELETATGSLTITNGVVAASLTLENGETPAIDSFDTVSFLQEDLNNLLSTSTGEFMLGDGVVNGTLTFDNEAFEVTNFDLATVTANALSDWVSSLDTTIPLDSGAFSISSETPFGAIDGIIDVAGGDLDVAITSFAGDFDFSFDFPETAQFPLDVPTPLGTLTANLNLDSGNIEVPLVLGNSIDISLSSLSGSVGLSEGAADLTIQTNLGDFTVDFDLANTLREATVDFLTGISGNLSLNQGQLNVALNNADGSSLFADALDLLALNNELIAFAQQTNGSIELAEGLFSGQITIADNMLPVNQSVGDLTALLNRPIDQLVNSPTALIGELA